MASPPNTETDTEAKTTITLTGVPETLLATLQARATDAASPKPVLGDPFAAAALRRLDYDFTRTSMSSTHAAAVSLRARTLDRWTEAFLAVHRAEGATVLHLACGLDSRARRLAWGEGDGPGKGAVRWIDVDLPEVVAVRRAVLGTADFEVDGDGRRRDYSLVAANVTDEAWLEEVPADRPTIVVMEGLLGYLTEEQATGLLLRLTRRFPPGGELLFECLNWFMVTMQWWIRAVRDTGAVFRWAIEDPKTLERLDPQLKMQDCLAFATMPGVEEFPPMGRVWMGIISWTPSLKDSMKMVRFKF